MAISVGTTVQIKKDVISHYSGQKGIVVECAELERYDFAVEFPNNDTLGFNEDEVTTPRSTK